MSQQQRDPTEEEWKIINKLLESVDKPQPKRDMVKEFFEWLDGKEGKE